MSSTKPTTRLNGGVHLPSGLSPSVLEFHQVNRSAGCGRVADYYRRFGLTPTPEHAQVSLHFAVCTRGCAVCHLSLYRVPTRRPGLTPLHGQGRGLHRQLVVASYWWGGGIGWKETTVTALPVYWTAADWAAFDSEGRTELVGGLPVVNPPVAARNVFAASQLQAQLRGSAPAASGRRSPYLCLGGVQIETTLGDEHPTYRVSDATIVRQDADLTGIGVAPADILLVVEIISPGSARTDRILKRAEYAAVGIPQYLLVDLIAGRDNLTLLHLGPDGQFHEAANGRTIIVTIEGISTRLEASELLP